MQNKDERKILMVHLKNIQQYGNLVTFDGYINGNLARHFTMTVKHK